MDPKEFSDWTLGLLSLVRGSSRYPECGIACLWKLKKESCMVGINVGAFFSISSA